MAPAHPGVLSNFYALHPSDGNIATSEVYPLGRAPPVPMMKVIKGRLECNESVARIRRRDEKYHGMAEEAEIELARLEPRIAANPDRIRDGHWKNREEVLQQRRRCEFAWAEMTSARRGRRKWDEATWREVWKSETEALHLLTVSTTRMVTSSMPRAPSLEKSNSDTSGQLGKGETPTSPETDENEGSNGVGRGVPPGKSVSADDTAAALVGGDAALTRFRESISFESLDDSITAVEEWPRPLKIAIDNSLQGIVGWLGSVQKRKCVYWLWHDSGLPAQFDNSREDVLRYVASVCRGKGALGSAFFFPKRATLKSFKETFFPTLVFELSAYIPRLGPLAANACQTQGAHILGRAWLTQVQELVLKQYSLLPTEDRQKPILMIIDCLDRCTRREVPQLLNALTSCIEALPICMLISSKRVPGMEQRFNSWGGKDYVVEGELKVELPKEEEKTDGADGVNGGSDDELGDPTTPRPGHTFS